MPPPTTMIVSMPLELTALVQGQIAWGRYRSASGVVRAALRLLEEGKRRRDPPPATRIEAPPRARTRGR